MKRSSDNDRKYIYQVCIKFGLSVFQSRRVRDWTTNHVVLFLRNNTIIGKELFSSDKKDNWDIEQLKTVLEDIV